MNNLCLEGKAKLVYEFENPADEFSPMPFWFWNDTLTEEELSRQIYAFKEKGVNGFVIHPRLGLDTTIEYMGETWLHYVRFAVELAKELGMKVILYDEAMYPSGACGGKVVAENPDFAAKGLKMTESPDLEEGETLIATAEYEGKMRYFVMAPTYGVIRGVYYGQDDCDPGAPRAADLLNPQAVDAFIRLTHQTYYDALSEHFGDTIIAIFTDEPSLLGRCARGGLRPWTDGLMDEFRARGYDENDLPALFLQYNDENDLLAFIAEGGRKAEQAKVNLGYEDLIHQRMNTQYYGKIAKWCTDHGIALTGHPGGSMDIGLLSHFGIPCQDIVWRYLYPGDPTNVRGPHSTMGKCASDSARHLGKRRNGNECFGVCGHKDDQYAFTRDDMKWYIDWLFARGCNLIIPHAFYYSLRDKRRDERPPEVGMHSVFWDEYKEISDYVKRCCSVNTDSVNITDIAVLCSENFLPDVPVKPLYENQIEFNYLERALLDKVTVKDGKANIANQSYGVIIVERDYDEKTEKFLQSFRAAGGAVVDFREYKEKEIAFVQRIRDLSNTTLNIEAAENLRMTHVRKYGVDIVFLSNEGEAPLSTVVYEEIEEIWDSEKGTRTPHTGGILALTLAPRESVHLILK